MMIQFKQIWLILIFLFAAGSAAVAGDENTIAWIQSVHLRIDSLKQALYTQSPTEKQKMEIYQLISATYHNVAPDSSMFYADKGISIALKISDYETLARLYADKAVAATFSGNYEAAIATYELLTELGAKTGNERYEVHALAMTGFAYDHRGMYNTAIDYYLKALKIFERMEWTDNCVALLANLSEMNRRMGNTEMALHYLREAEIKGSVWKEDEDLYGWRMPQVFNEYASVYLNNGDFDEALRYALKADSVNPIHATINRCETKSLLANIYLQKQNYDRALQYAKESYIQANILKDISLYAKAGKILSDVYLAQKRYHEAETEALRVWQIDSTNIDESRMIAKNIALANLHMGNAAKAAYFLNRYSEMNAQFSEKSFHTTISDMVIKYETEKKEQRIDALENERRLYVWLGIAGVVLSFALGLILLQKQRNARKEKQLTATRSFLDGEMRERTRIAHDLHDRLSGNFSAIKIELGKHAESQQNINELVDNCIRDIRDSAHNLMPVSLQFGMKVALEDFAAKFPNVSFHFFGAEKRIEGRIEYVIYCCACELVYNSVRHSGAKNINLQLIQDGKYATLTVSDDGCGFNEKTVTKGFGLKSIRNRVASCNGKIDIDSAPEKGTETTIELKITN